MRYKTKKVSKGGVSFDSKFEERCYLRLKELGIPFTYNETSFLLSPKTEYPNYCGDSTDKNGQLKDTRLIREMTYKPDFIGENMSWVIETKGYATPQFILRWKLFKSQVAKLDSPPMLFMPTTNAQLEEAIQIISNSNKN